MQPDTISITGTVTGNTSANTLIGTGTVFDQELLENDLILLSSGAEYQVQRIKSPTELTVSATTLAADVTSVSITKTGISDIWGDRFLKQFATAKIKQQWGNNLKKFGGIQLPGGVTLNGKEIYDEATEELAKMEEEMYQMGSLPSEIYTG
jgi:hypothetical protein